MATPERVNGRHALVGLFRQSGRLIGYEDVNDAEAASFAAPLRENCPISRLETVPDGGDRPTAPGPIRRTCIVRPIALDRIATANHSAGKTALFSTFIAPSRSCRLPRLFAISMK